jgi:hypothetical protein
VRTLAAAEEMLAAIDRGTYPLTRAIVRPHRLYDLRKAAQRRLMTPEARAAAEAEDAARAALQARYLAALEAAGANALEAYFLSGRMAAKVEGDVTDTDLLVLAFRLLAEHAAASANALEAASDDDEDEDGEEDEEEK